MNIFEQATRAKLRFDSPQGQLSVEDLWELPLTSTSSAKANLDAIAIGLQRALREVGEIVSFVKPVVQKTNDFQLRFDVVKHIIDVKVAERDAEAEAKSRREKKQRVLEIIESRKDEELRGKSLDELTALAQSL
jgi:hypothetical protein